jgi:hypothetical protein
MKPMCQRSFDRHQLQVRAARFEGGVSIFDLA